MTESRSFNDAPLPDHAARCNLVRDRMLLGLVLFTLIRAGEALAGDQAAIIGTAAKTEFGVFRKPSPPTTALLESPGIFTAPAAAGEQGFSATEFRPRKRSVLDSDPVVSSFGDAPLIRGSSVWERMSEYKSHDRVQLLTLWETTGSSVSLQAGKRGDPSLQWTSRLMNRGGATQGLLDRLFAVSLAHAGNGLRNAARPSSAPPPAKTAGVAQVAGPK
jgi:hypothetical protein